MVKLLCMYFPLVDGILFKMMFISIAFFNFLELTLFKFKHIILLSKKNVVEFRDILLKILLIK